MPIYMEGLLWYLLLLDSVIYAVLSWTQTKHRFKTHWLSEHFPLNKLFGLVYLLLILWVGLALLRLEIILFK